jgi:hypothetical protein|nr:MAG TPA: endonuclease [Caudoviricetes sp.]
MAHQELSSAARGAGLNALERKRKTQFITQKEIMEYLEYDPETGLFTAIKSHGTLWRSGKLVGHKNQEGYITITLLGKIRKAHRLAWIYVYGEDIDGYEIDHVNGDKSDNRICNLRISSHQQNMFNMKKKSTNKSGVKGVHFDKRCNKWRAQTSINRKRVHIGLFNTIEAAEKAVREFMVDNHKEFVNLG